MVTRTLTAADFDAVLAAFNEAFSDYVVPLQLTREQLGEMLRRRGWSPEASIAAFEGDRIVAFTLNGVEGDRAYDSGTGVVPSHRRRGLAKEMMLRSCDVLRERGCASYVLEVLESNTKAWDLYRSLGFAESRMLQCWRYEPRDPAPPARTTGTIEAAWCDVAPSWQNSTASVSRAGDEHVVLGDADGFAILFPSNGDVPQLAVRPGARRRGVGTRLLAQAAAVARKPLRIMNVDDRDAGIAAFLETSGATRFVRQAELFLLL